MDKNICSIKRFSIPFWGLFQITKRLFDRKYDYLQSRLITIRGSSAAVPLYKYLNLTNWLGKSFFNFVFLLCLGQLTLIFDRLKSLFHEYYFRIRKLDVTKFEFGALILLCAFTHETKLAKTTLIISIGFV